MPKYLQLFVLKIIGTELILLVLCQSESTLLPRVEVLAPDATCTQERKKV